MLSALHGHQAAQATSQLRSANTSEAVPSSVWRFFFFIPAPHAVPSPLPKSNFFVWCVEIKRAWLYHHGAALRFKGWLPAPIEVSGSFLIDFAGSRMGPQTCGFCVRSGMLAQLHAETASQLLTFSC